MRRLLTTGITLLFVGALTVVGSPPAAAASFTVQRDVVYNAHGMVLDTYKPNGAGGRPIVVFVHGGGWIDNNKDWAIEYAASPSTTSRPSPSTTVSPPGTKFPAAFNDTRDAIAWARTNAADIGGDPNKIVLAGYSSGATMAALVGLHPSVDVRGVIGTSGSYDMDHTYATHPALRSTLDLYMGSTPLAYNSPVKQISPDDPPVLQHGIWDVFTAAKETTRMADALGRQQVTCFLRYYVAGHELLTRKSNEYPRALSDMLAFTLAVTR